MNITSYRELVSFPWDYWMVYVEPYHNYTLHVADLVVGSNGIMYNVCSNLIFASSIYTELRYKNNSPLHLSVRSGDTHTMTRCDTLQDVLELLERLIMLEKL